MRALQPLGLEGKKKAALLKLNKICCLIIHAPDVPVIAMESLQQSKVYQKEQKRQFKELKELVRRHQKKMSELLREINNKYKKTARQCSKSRYQKIKA